MKIKASYTNTPSWRDVYSQTKLPTELAPLERLVYNLWWVWNNEALDLFNELDPQAWQKADGNPVLFLKYLTKDKIQALLDNKDLMGRIKMVFAKFDDYMHEKFDTNKTSIAYFSMEYGFTHVLKIYSGGLGVLAGDYLKEASDSHVDLTGVGFLYRYGYFTQTISPDGQQIAKYESQDFGSLPIQQVYNEDGNPMILAVPFHDRDVYANIWKVNVGRISLYLLDTDIEANSEYDRAITHQLYGGDWENRLKQEYMLGIGGILLLNKLGIKKEVYHCNEGHAAFINLQRLIDLIEVQGLSFNQALEVVRSSGLYTVHTPIPAGHDYFDEGLLRKYMSQYPHRLGISWEEFFDMGRANPGSDEKFSMSTFALNTCQEANGVSLLHGIVSRNMFQSVWQGYFPEELHVGHVTNGVHMPTWTSKEMKNLYKKYFDSNFYNDQSNHDIWKKIYDVPDQELWDARVMLKKRLVKYIKEHMIHDWVKNQAAPSTYLSIIEQINPDALLVGFGRRFATYKRAHLLFTDLDRLSKLVNNEKHPIQFLYTGKAHPADGAGQGLIKHIIEISRRPEFFGKIIFLENYDMELAKRLISGVDVWLNTPTRPLEASGTSGEKAEMNGVLNFSVLDGWWYEGYKENAGWALTDKRTYTNQEYQDELDAVAIYHTFENKILPLYYERGEKDYSHGWIEYIKNSIANIAPEYTTKRMIDDYINWFYKKLAKRSGMIIADNFAKAKEIAAWKEGIAATWDQLTVDSTSFELNGVTLPFSSLRAVAGGDKGISRLVIDKKGIPGEIGAEAVIMKHEPDTNTEKLFKTLPYSLIKQEGTKLYFELKADAIDGGHYKYGIRLYPKHELLPHRMDFAYVKWI